MKLLAALAVGLLALLAALSLAADLREGLLLPAAGRLFAAAALLYVAREWLADVWAARSAGRRLHGAAAPRTEPVSSSPVPRR